MSFKTYGEPDINRLLAVFRGEIPDRVPIFETLIEDKHIEHMLGYSAGNTLGAMGEVAKGASDEAASARPMRPEDYIKVCQTIGQDVMIVEAIWAPFKKIGEDGRLHIINNRSIKSREDIDKIVVPTQEDVNEKVQYIKEYKEATRGTGIGVTLLTGAFFQLNYEFIVGLTDFMVKIIEDLEFVEQLLDMATNYYAELVEAACEAGIDFLFFADDVAFKSGLFVRPEIFKSLWRPRAEKIIAPALERGIPVMFHSDGKIDSIMPMIIDMGISCINPMDPYCIDYRDYKKRFGDKITLSGNIDIEFPLVRGTPEDVRKDVIEHLKVLKPGGRYIFGSSHSIVNYIPFENYEAMVNTFYEYAKY